MSRRTEHPEPEELLALQLGALPDDERDRVEEHLSLCPECAQAVLDFEGFPDLDDTGPEIPPEVERKLEDQKRRLLELARDPGDPSGGYLEPREPGLGTAAGSGSGPGGWLGRAPVAWAVAAALLVATVGMGVWNARRVGEVDVYIGAAVGVRGEEEALEIPASRRTAIVVLTVPGGFSEYRAELASASGESLSTELERAERHGASGSFYISLNVPPGLPPGSYVYKVSGVDNGGATYLGRQDVELVDLSVPSLPSEDDG